MLYEELSKDIISAFYEVHKVLGFGFLENVYQNALYKELISRGLKCECHKELDVYYNGESVGVYKADMIVEDCIILELKAVSTLRPEHEWQLINYLKATDIELGLLLNFGEKPQMKRKVYANERK